MNLPQPGEEDEAVEKLVAGLHVFQNNIFSSQRDLFERLAQSQEPDALFITCSDSRIDARMMTQTKLGELFILRNAGNIVPAYGGPSGGEVATIEFAVAGLNIQDIILCGHTGCGAMKALLDQDSLEDMPAVKQWLNHAESTRRIVRDKYTHLKGEELLAATVEENVLQQLENLRTHPVVASGLSQGKLKLHAWVYDMKTGEVFAYHPDEAQFISVRRRPAGALDDATPLWHNKAL